MSRSRTLVGSALGIFGNPGYFGARGIWE